MSTDIALLYMDNQYNPASPHPVACASTTHIYPSTVHQKSVKGFVTEAVGSSALRDRCVINKPSSVVCTSNDQWSTSVGRYTCHTNRLLGGNNQTLSVSNLRTWCMANLEWWGNGRNKPLALWRGEQCQSFVNALAEPPTPFAPPYCKCSPDGD